MTKIFTMVKGEVDIVSDWVLYHGTIFGFANLYIIDNLSQDGTWEELKSLKNKYNINICRLPDYTKKGDYMTMLMKSFCVKGELAFPIDIDEFIVCYDKQTNLPVGVFCVKDTKPRTMSVEEIDFFMDLAKQAEQEINKGAE